MHAGQLERNHIGAEQGNDPADGPDKSRAGLARPVHGLRKRDFGDHTRKAFRQDVDGAASSDLTQVSVVFALRGRFDGEIFGLDAMLARESFDGLGIGGTGGAGQLFFSVRKTFGQAIHAQHEAARGGIQSNIGCGKAKGGEVRAQAFERAMNHPIGDFFGADFEKKGEAHCATPCWSAQACATPTASLRTR